MHVDDLTDYLDKTVLGGNAVGGDWNGPQCDYGRGAVERVGVCWSPNRFVLAEAAKENVRFLIIHERLYLPHASSVWYDVPAESIINNTRRDILERSNLAVYRLHSPIDGFVLDGMIQRAQRTGAACRARRKFMAVMEWREDATPRTRVLDMDLPVYRDISRHLSRSLGIMIGGFGLNQHHMPQVLQREGADTILMGDARESIIEGCNELGLNVVVSSHMATEEPGLENFTRHLAAQFPNVAISYLRGQPQTKGERP